MIFHKTDRDRFELQREVIMRARIILTPAVFFLAAFACWAGCSGDDDDNDDDADDDADDDTVEVAGVCYWFCGEEEDGVSRCDDTAGDAQECWTLASAECPEPAHILFNPDCATCEDDAECRPEWYAGE